MTYSCTSKTLKQVNSLHSSSFLCFSVASFTSSCCNMCEQQKLIITALEIPPTPCGGTTLHTDEPPTSVMLDHQFMVNCYKVETCMLSHPHGWKVCPYVHPGEPVQRRHPSAHRGALCPAVKKGLACEFGPQTCKWAHNSFELWLHPSRYKTKMCCRGAECTRGICFFAHSESELREPVKPSANSIGSSSSGSSATTSAAAAELALHSTIAASAAATGLACTAPLLGTNGLPAVQAVQVSAAWAPAAYAVQAVLPAAVQLDRLPWISAQTAQSAQAVTLLMAVHAVQQVPISWSPPTKALHGLSVQCSAGSSNGSHNSSLEVKPVISEQQQQLDALRLQQEIEIHRLNLQQMQDEIARLQRLQQQQQHQRQPALAVLGTSSQPSSSLMTDSALVMLSGAPHLPYCAPMSLPSVSAAPACSLPVTCSQGAVAAMLVLTGQ